MSCFCAWQLFLPIYKAEEIIISVGLRPFDICYDNPLLWHYIKISFIIFYILANCILINAIISRFNLFKKCNLKDDQQINEINNSSLKLLIGKDISSNQNIYIPESGLYQNFLITGTIGTGKTSSAMYPFTEQLIKYNSLHPNNKLGILILDVKGNYFTFNNETNRAFVERFRDWYTKQYVTTEEVFGSYTSDLFTTVDATKTKCYMCIGSSAGAGYQTPKKLQDGKTYPFEVGITMIPQQDTLENLEKAGKKPTMISQGPSICLFKKQNNQEVAAAWLFAKYITSNHKFQAKCSMNNGYTPAVLDIAENDMYAKFLANAGKGNQYLQALAVQHTLQMKDYYFVSPAFVGSSAARDAMADLMKNSFKQTPTTTAAAMIKDLFDKTEKDLNRKYDK